MSLLAILGVDLAQNLTEYERWLCVLIKLTNRSIANETNDVRGQGPSNINLSLFVCFLIFDCYRAS